MGIWKNKYVGMESPACCLACNPTRARDAHPYGRVLAGVSIASPNKIYQQLCIENLVSIEIKKIQQKEIK